MCETSSLSISNIAIRNFGLWTLFMNGEKVDNGKFIVVWKKVQGKWYVHRNCFNSGNPV